MDDIHRQNTLRSISLHNLAELNIDSLKKLSIGMDLEDEFAIAV